MQTGIRSRLHHWMSQRNTHHANMARSTGTTGWRRVVSVMQVPVHKKEFRNCQLLFSVGYFLLRRTLVLNRR